MFGLKYTFLLIIIVNYFIIFVYITTFLPCHLL